MRDIKVDEDLPYGGTAHFVNGKLDDPADGVPAVRFRDGLTISFRKGKLREIRHGRQRIYVKSRLKTDITFEILTAAGSGSPRLPILRAYLPGPAQDGNLSRFRTARYRSPS
jgi:hypothetical protein